MSTTVLDMFKLTGKTAVITGGTGGLGIDMAQALAEAGADIVSLELPNDPLSQNLRDAIKPSGRKLTAFDCNVRDPQSIKDAFKAIKDAGIKLDILVNSAGVTRHMKVEETPVEDLNAVMEINFRGTYVCIQEFGRELLQENRKGKIINLASMAAYLAQTNISVYCSSKAAVQNLTRAVSNEWAGRGITCNSICPGFFQTSMCRDLWSDEQFSAKVVARTSIGRWGQPEDLKGLTVFLASSASDFITGEGIVIDGGIIGR